MIGAIHWRVINEKIKKNYIKIWIFSFFFHINRHIWKVARGS